MRFAGFYRQLLGRSSLQAFLPARGVDCGQCDGVKSRPTQLRVRISFGFQDMILGTGTSHNHLHRHSTLAAQRPKPTRGAPRANRRTQRSHRCPRAEYDSARQAAKPNEIPSLPSKLSLTAAKTTMNT